MKSFKEFNLIIEGRSRAEAQKDLQSKTTPGDWELVNAGSSESPSWRVRLKSNREVAGSRSAPTVAGKSKESKEQKARTIAKKTQLKQEPEKKKAAPKKPEEKKDDKIYLDPRENYPVGHPKGFPKEAPKKKPVAKKPAPKPAPKKPAPKKPSDEVRCLGSGCPGTPVGPGENVRLDGKGNPIAKKPADKKVYAGGSKDFDERTGKRKVSSSTASATSSKPKPKVSSSTASSTSSSTASTKPRPTGRPYARGAKAVYHSRQQRKYT